MASYGNSQSPNPIEAFNRSKICSFCQQQNNNSARLISECNRYICGECNQNLLSSLDESRSYRCIACLTSHTMPRDGLTDVSFFFQMMQLQAERLRPPNGEILQRLVGDVTNELESLKAFTTEKQRKVVVDKCELLDLEVSEAAEKACIHIDKIERELRGQVDDYRNRCLERLPAESSSSENFEAVPTTRARSEVDALSDEIQVYSQRWAQIDSYQNEDDIKQAIIDGQKYQVRMKELGQKLTNEAFNGSNLHFDERKLFQLEKSHLGKLVKKTMTNDFQLLDEPRKKLNDHIGKVNQVMFLPDGRLASCSNDRTVRVWNTVSGKSKLLPRDHADCVLALALLPNGWLASGSVDTTIKLWDLSLETKLVRTIEGHDHAILSLKVLKNGYLASYSADNTIKVWNPYSERNVPLLVITGHGNTDTDTFLPLFGVLSNGFLIACSRSTGDIENSVLRIWHSHDGQLVKEASIGLKVVKALLVLSNDQIVIGADIGIERNNVAITNGAIKIIDLEDDNKSRKNEKAHDLGIDCLLQLSTCYFASAGQEERSPFSIKVWDFYDLASPLLIIDTKHTSTIRSLSVSYDETILASGSGDDTIKLWPISTKPILPD